MNFPEKLLKLRKSLRLSQVALGSKLGLSSTYISALENGAREPSETVANYVDLLLQAFDAGLLVEGAPGKPQEDRVQTPKNVTISKEDPAPYRVQGMNKVPIVSWAHAGDAMTYEELPTHWQNSITSECRDPHAFAVTLEGDSMRATIPGVSFEPGDIIIVQPSEQSYSGGFVVAKFANDGIIFRRFETTGEKVRLVPLNERYPVSEHTRDEFHWIYPVFARVTHLSSR